MAKLKTMPQLAIVATDQQNHGLEADLNIDREHRVAAGHPAADIDNTLYDAFGQRQVSTIFTQLNQYHVVLEVEPEFQQNSRRSGDHLRSLRPAAARFR